MSEQHPTPSTLLIKFLQSLMEVLSYVSNPVFHGQDTVSLTSGEAKNPGPNELALFGHGSLRNAGLGGSFGAAIARDAAREIIRDPARAAHNVREAASALKQVVDDYFNGPAPAPAPKQKTTAVPKTFQRPTAAPTPAPAPAPAQSDYRPRSTKVERATVLSPSVKERVTSVRNRAKKSRNNTIQARAASSHHQSAVSVRTNAVNMSLPKRPVPRISEETFTVEAYIPIQQVAGVQGFTQWSNFDNPAFGLARNAGVRLQPGDGSLGPVIQMAAAYQTHWRPKAVRLRWVNTTANTSAGTVLVSMDGSGNILPPSTRAEFVASCVCIDSNVANPWECVVPLSELGSPSKWLRCRTSEYFDGDRADYDFGCLWLSTENTDLALNAQIGRLELTITIEFKCETRILRIAGLYSPVNVFSLNRGSFTNTNENLTVSMIPVGPDRAGVRITGSDFVLDPGTYLVHYDLVASGTTAGTTSNLTVSWSGTALSNNIFDNFAQSPGSVQTSLIGVGVARQFTGQFVVSALPGLNLLTCNFNSTANAGIEFSALFTPGAVTIRQNRVFFTRIGR